MKLISICVPVLNEEENIANTLEVIESFFKKNLTQYRYEIIFTDNHSDDKSESIIFEITKNNPNVKYIRFNKDIGYDKSILEAYKNSTGDAAIVIDCDLQDPVEIIKDFILKWENGHDVVYGIRKKRDESKVFTTFRKIYYRIMNANSEKKYPLDAGDFRLVDRKVIDRFKNNKNLYPYVRGLTFSLSKNSKGIEYDRTNRKLGKSKLAYYNTFTYAVSYLIEETRIFVRLFARLNLILILFSILFTLVNCYLNFKFISLFQNTILILLIVIIFILTIISEYILRLYFQIKDNNKIIYEKKINFQDDEE